MLAGLRHPSLPVVRESFAEGQSVFLAMELVPGDDLATLIERSGSPFPADQVLRWAVQLLDALEYLHTQQPPLIHGDITPQNLKLNQSDQVVLLGLGLVPGAAHAIDRRSSAARPCPRRLCRPSRPGAQPPTSAATCSRWRPRSTIC